LPLRSFAALALKRPAATATIPHTREVRRLSGVHGLAGLAERDNAGVFHAAFVSNASAIVSPQPAWPS
jgi:hypothetical protein